MIDEILTGIIKRIDSTHARAIMKRAESGSVRAFELRWDSLLREIHDFRVVPTWTEKQRAQARDLIERMTAEEALRLVEFCVRQWADLLSRSPTLPPKPTFSAIYAWRDTFYAEMLAAESNVKKEAEDEHGRAARQKENAEFMRKHAALQGESADETHGLTGSLLDMFRQARARHAKG